MMFEKLLKWIRNMLGTYFEESKAPATDIIISSSMEAKLSEWARMYEGQKEKKSTVNPIGLAASICAEFARLVTMECVIAVTGSPRADYIAQQINRIDLTPCTELACAFGGLVFKPFVSDNSVVIDIVQGDCFYPTAFDSTGSLTGAIFADQIIRNKKVYTRLEKHDYINGSHRIENIAFESSSSASIGSEISLESIPEWTDIAPFLEIPDCDRPLFSYFKMPFQNTIDRHSPLGVSVFSRAEQLIRDADEQYGRYLWEFEGGELAVDAAADYLMTTAEGTPVLPKGKGRLFRGLTTRDQNFYHIFAPALRDESLKRGFNTILQRIEFQCGLAYGTLSDPTTVEKTAEEIRTSKARSYNTVKSIQKKLESALSDLIYAVDKLATVYSLAPAGEYRTAFDWDDSILNDPEAVRARFERLMIAGKFPLWRYLVEFEGYTEDEAKAIQSESSSLVGDPYVDPTVS